jgi:nicotinamide mononucleotide transporter
VAGAALGALFVVLAIREIAWCWPVGIANALLFFVVYWQARLYGAAVLQLLYLLTSVYGWYEWLRGGRGHGRLSVSRTPPGWGAGLALGAVAATVVLGLFLKHRTDAALPFADAATTSASLAAQWMATRKWLENWVVWMGVNVANVAICVSQDLLPMAALYALFLVLAFFGLRAWRSSLAASPSA